MPTADTRCDAVPVYAEAVLVEDAGASTEEISSRSRDVLSRENPQLAAAIRRAIAAKGDVLSPQTHPLEIEKIVQAVERAFVAKPRTKEVKQKATSSKEAETTTEGSEREWTVYVLTGGLDIQPRS